MTSSPVAGGTDQRTRRRTEFFRDVDEGMAAHRDGRAPRFTGR
jgi:hypothetical protein